MRWQSVVGPYGDAFSIHEGQEEIARKQDFASGITRPGTLVKINVMRQKTQKIAMFG
jgi:hypothetical protein